MTTIGSSSLFKETADIETASSDYARRFSGEIGTYFLEVQTQSVLDMISPWAKGKVLDVGGGHAQISVPLVQAGFDVTVTGSSQTCRKRLDTYLDPTSFQFECCDLLALPFEESSFDVVVAFRLLPHVDAWKKLISEMCRVAKYAVIVDYPDIQSANFISKQLFKAKKAYEGNTRPFTCFRQRALLAEFSHSGFECSSKYAEFFVPMVIHRAVKSAFFSKIIESLFRWTGLTSLFGSPVVLRLTSKKLETID